MMPRAALVLTILVAACNAPEKFYSSLGEVPELFPLTVTSYAVGDTMTISGKLGGKNAKVIVQVGGVTAPVVAQWDSVNQLATPTGPDGVPPSGTTFNREVDYVNVVITAAMGIGPRRPVLVTVFGVQRSGGTINISPTPPVPARSDTLRYVDTVVTYAQSTNNGSGLMARGDNGDGKVYWFSGDTVRLWQTGGAGTSVVLASLADQNGTFHNVGSAGTFNTFAAVDKTGRYLYASLVTDSTASDTMLTFRLIKVDLTGRTIQTLNRTPFPLNSADITTQFISSLTMTGPVGSVFLPPLSQIFPGTNGTIYFVTDGVAPFVSFGGTYSTWLTCDATQGPPSAVGKIDASGTVSYVLKSNCTLPAGLPINTPTGPVDLLPTLNATHPWSWIDAIDPDSGVIYASGIGTSPNGQPVTQGWAKIAYNIRTQQSIAVFAPTPTLTSTDASGPFASIDGQFGTLGVVRGGGHRAWMQSLPTATAPARIEIADFDAETVSPYVAQQGLPLPQFAQALAVFGVPAPYIVSSTPGGDPLIALQNQSGFSSSYLVVPPVDARSASAGQRLARRPLSRSSVRPHH